MAPILHRILWSAWLIFQNVVFIGLGCAFLAALYYILWSEGWFRF